MSSLEQHDLVGTHEIAERTGQARTTVYAWIDRYPDFPQPVRRLRMGSVFSWPPIRRWLVANGRGHLIEKE